MTTVVLIINAIAMITCGVAAGMNFSSGDNFVGMSMTMLCFANMMFFITNLGRLFT